MSSLLNLKERLKINPYILIIYVIVYYCWGYLMNEIGIMLEIAAFKYKIQIFLCYVLFMIPVSLYLRKLTYFQQYLYGLLFMGLYEFGGYAFETSYAYPMNLLDQSFGIRNFSLAMTLFFASYFPLGNLLVKKIAGLFNLQPE